MADGNIEPATYPDTDDHSGPLADVSETALVGETVTSPPEPGTPEGLATQLAERALSDADDKPQNTTEDDLAIKVKGILNNPDISLEIKKENILKIVELDGHRAIEMVLDLIMAEKQNKLQRNNPKGQGRELLNFLLSQTQNESQGPVLSDTVVSDFFTDSDDRDAIDIERKKELAEAILRSTRGDIKLQFEQVLDIEKNFSKNKPTDSRRRRRLQRVSGPRARRRGIAEESSLIELAFTAKIMDNGEEKYRYGESDIKIKQRLENENNENGHSSRDMRDKLVRAFLRSGREDLDLEIVDLIQKVKKTSRRFLSKYEFEEIITSKRGDSYRYSQSDIQRVLNFFNLGENTLEKKRALITYILKSQERSDITLTLERLVAIGGISWFDIIQAKFIKGDERVEYRYSGEEISNLLNNPGLDEVAQRGLVTVILDSKRGDIKLSIKDALQYIGVENLFGYGHKIVTAKIAGREGGYRYSGEEISSLLNNPELDEWFKQGLVEGILDSGRGDIELSIKDALQYIDVKNLFGYGHKIVTAKIAGGEGEYRYSGEEISSLLDNPELDEVAKRGLVTAILDSKRGDVNLSLDFVTSVYEQDFIELLSSDEDFIVRVILARNAEGEYRFSDNELAKKFKEIIDVEQINIENLPKIASLARALFESQGRFSSTEKVREVINRLAETDDIEKYEEVIHDILSDTDPVVEKMKYKLIRLILESEKEPNTAWNSVKRLLTDTTVPFFVRRLKIFEALYGIDFLEKKIEDIPDQLKEILKDKSMDERQKRGVLARYMYQRAFELAMGNLDEELYLLLEDARDLLVIIQKRKGPNYRDLNGEDLRKEVHVLEQLALIVSDFDNPFLIKGEDESLEKYKNRLLQYLGSRLERGERQGEESSDSTLWVIFKFLDNFFPTTGTEGVSSESQISVDCLLEFVNNQLNKMNNLRMESNSRRIEYLNELQSPNEEFTSDKESTVPLILKGTGLYNIFEDGFWAEVFLGEHAFEVSFTPGGVSVEKYNDKQKIESLSLSLSGLMEKIDGSKAKEYAGGKLVAVMFHEPKGLYKKGHEWQDSSEWNSPLGLALSEIDMLVALDVLDEEELKLIKLQLARKGLYVPIVRRNKEEGEIDVIFTEEEYERIRLNMTGVKAYGGDEIESALEENDRDDRLEEIIAQIEQDEPINLRLREITSVLQNGDFPRDILIIPTGSQARGTNLSLSDEDYIILIPRKYQHVMLEQIKDKLQTHFPEQNFKETISDDEYIQLVGEDGLDIGISRARSMVVAHRLNANIVEQRMRALIEQRIDTEDDRRSNERRLRANIILAKEILKEAGVYKVPDPGKLPGIAIEIWILNHGGSMRRAFRDFLEKAREANESLEIFREKFSFYLVNYSNPRENGHPADFFDSITQEIFGRWIQAARNFLNE